MAITRRRPTSKMMGLIAAVFVVLVLGYFAVPHLLGPVSTATVHNPSAAAVETQANPPAKQQP